MSCYFCGEPREKHIPEDKGTRAYRERCPKPDEVKAWDEANRWRTLPAGPDLDAIVAERVLGWTAIRSAVATAGLTGIPPTPQAQRSYVPMGLSSDPGGAWRVLEAMEERGIRLEQAGHTDGHDHRVYVFLQHREKALRSAPFRGEAEGPITTAFPLALCRAALAAVTVPS